MTATLHPPVHVLDLRTMAPRERHPLVSACFDALACGESLQLVNDDNPQPLRFQLEEQAFGQFEWAALETGPAVWRIQIARVADAAVPAAGLKADPCFSLKVR